MAGEVASAVRASLLRAAAKRRAMQRASENGGMPDWLNGTDPFDPAELEGMGVESTMNGSRLVRNSDYTPLTPAQTDGEPYGYDPNALAYVLRLLQGGFSPRDDFGRNPGPWGPYPSSRVRPGR